MAKRNKRAAMLLLLATLTMTGCAENQIPDLTDEQIQAVGEYVAITLMKYDAGNRSRLMDLSEYEGQWALEEESAASQKQPGMSPVDDTPVVNAPQVEAQEKPSYSMEEVLGLPEGCEITFTGNKICDYYPEDNGDLYFSLNATEGRKLLVLSFSIVNTSAQEQELDLLSSDITYKITVNSDYTKRALTSMLDYDLSVYSGSLTAGESTEVVLIIEVDEDMAEAIGSIGLNLKNGDKSCTVPLL